MPPTDLLEPAAEAAELAAVPQEIPRIPDGRSVFSVWWPLATSWIFMGLELPSVSAAIARLPNPTISLAAYGGVIFPLALLIESPIIMLLAASTALSKDLRSHELVRRFMWTAGLGFTFVHALVAWTPLFDVVVGGILGVPVEIREPARIGLRIMTPWTISIAYRRFHQGLLIRFGRSKLVSVGTAIRLATLVTVLTLGVTSGRFPGYVVGTTAVVASVVAEAIFAGFCAWPIVRGPLRAAPEITPALTQKRFMNFYIPLMLSPLIVFLATPITSAAISRMPRALESLAVWPALTGIVFTLRSTGFALNEVVVAMLERPGARPALERFTLVLALVTSGVLLLLAATPLGHAWFSHVAGLPPDLVALATLGVILAVPMPALSTAQSLWQGALVHAHRTRGVTESVGVFLLVAVVVLGLGIAIGRVTGLYVGLAAFVLGNVAQTLWLRMREQEDS